MADDQANAEPPQRSRLGLAGLLGAGFGALGALGGSAFRAWRSSAARRTSSVVIDHLLGEDMTKKKTPAQPGDSAAVYLRLDAATLERLEAFAAAEEGAPSRTEAARRLIMRGLQAKAPEQEVPPEQPRFQPGDRVTTNRHGTGVVTEGPIHSVHYAVTFDDPGDAPPPRVNERGLRAA